MGLWSFCPGDLSTRLPQHFELFFKRSFCGSTAESRNCFHIPVIWDIHRWILRPSRRMTHIIMQSFFQCLSVAPLYNFLYNKINFWLYQAMEYYQIKSAMDLEQHASAGDGMKSTLFMWSWLRNILLLALDKSIAAFSI